MVVFMLAMAATNFLLAVGATLAGKTDLSAKPRFGILVT
jgi:hypothetical protein